MLTIAGAVTFIAPENFVNWTLNCPRIKKPECIVRTKMLMKKVFDRANRKSEYRFVFNNMQLSAWKSSNIFELYLSGKSSPGQLKSENIQRFVWGPLKMFNHSNLLFQREQQKTILDKRFHENGMTINVFHSVYFTCSVLGWKFAVGCTFPEG